MRLRSTAVPLQSEGSMQGLASTSQIPEASASTRFAFRSPCLPKRGSLASCCTRAAVAEPTRRVLHAELGCCFLKRKSGRTCVAAAVFAAAAASAAQGCTLRPLRMSDGHTGV